MPTIRAGDVWLRFEQEGEGDPVLLVHGSGSDADRTFRETGFAAALVRAGRRVVSVDARGHGASGGPRGAFEPGAVASDLEELLRYANARRVDVVGHAEGAAAALALAMRRPDRVRTVALLAPEAAAVGFATRFAELPPTRPPVLLVAAGAATPGGPEALLAKLLEARLVAVADASPATLTRAPAAAEAVAAFPGNGRERAA